MLGKTNITTLSEGAIVTEIEDFKWIQIQSGIRSDFVKTIFQNGYLAAITADGTAVYSTDGEVWKTLAMGDVNYRLNDIDWDGRRFLLVGSYKEDSTGTSEETGLIISTTDFSVWEKISTLPYAEYFTVSPRNGRYNIVGRKEGKEYILTTDLTEEGTQETQLEKKGKYLQYIIAVKSSSGDLVCIHSYEYGIGSSAGRVINYIDIAKINSNGTVIKLQSSSGGQNPNIMSVFECKDKFYLMYLLDTDNYRLNMVTSSDEVMTVCTGQNFAFSDGIYFNGCELFINNHEMLVVKRGESIADKTLDDLIEIAPEFTMNCITKAFGQLYIFGNQGLILKSSVETNNGEAIAVQTLSAKKALADAKQYTDEKYAALDARIAALEAVVTE